jgi:hypothetical protein
MSRANNALHILTLYPFHFLKVYLLSNVPLARRQMGTAWEPTKLEKLFLSPSSQNVVCLTILPMPFSLSLSLCLTFLIETVEHVVVAKWNVVPVLN